MAMGDRHTVYGETYVEVFASSRSQGGKACKGCAGDADFILCDSGFNNSCGDHSGREGTIFIEYKPL